MRGVLGGLTGDARHAIRGLLRNPGFTFTSLTTLALAIGANIAIFTLAHALIFASLPVVRPDRLIEVSTQDPRGGKGNLSIPAFRLIQKQASVFSNMFLWSGGGMENLEMNGEAFAGSVDEVGGDYYSTLGVAPLLGRFFSREESGVDRFTPARVAVIGYRDWQGHYRGDSRIIGKTILINGKGYSIIGVAPKSFPGLIREIAADATVPIAAAAASAEGFYDLNHTYYTVIGRLRDGVSAAQAKAQIETQWPAVRPRTVPASAPDQDLFLTRRVDVEPAARGISFLRERFTRPLQLLFGIVALLLMLACVNLANVALARAYGRAAEFGLRAALGATRWRLLRASIVESVLLGLSGAVPGLALAYWASAGMAHFVWQGYVPLTLSVRPNGSVALFSAVAAVSAGLLFGLLPAWLAGRQDPGAVLQRASQRITGGLGFAGRAMVAVQIALSFAILAAALLFGRSLGNVAGRDPGFAVDHLLVAQLFPRSTYGGVDMPANFRQLLESVRSIPGVTAATIAHDRPVGFEWKEVITPSNVRATYHLVGPGFFETLGMRIVEGRDFTLDDGASRPQVAIVSAKLAGLLARSGDVIGRRVKIGREKGEWEVVGIASDAALDDPRTPNTPAIYSPILQQPDYLGWGDAIVRTPGSPVLVERALRERIEALGREYPLRIETVSEEVGRSLLPERLLALLTGFFGGVGLLLAGIGLYGLLSYTVSQRVREIGVRGALGASRGAIAGLFLREVALLLAIGLAAGLGAALWGGRLLAALLYGLSGHDPAALAISGVLLTVVALAASLIPAVRAARIDPGVALRHE